MADIDVRYITEALNGKIDMPNGASQGSVDFVVSYKTPTDSDPTWYRVYKSGWVEQGGNIVSSSDAYTTPTVNLLKAMKDTSYYINIQSSRGANSSIYSPCLYAKTTSSFSAGYVVANGVGGALWQVSGQIDPTELQRILGGN